MAVHVRRVGIQPAEVLVHHLNLRPEHVVLLLCLANIFAIALQSLHLTVELTLVTLC